MDDEPEIEVIHIDLGPIVEREYLGDGVYCGHDSFQIWIWTEGNRIALDPNVMANLASYSKRLFGS